MAVIWEKILTRKFLEVFGFKISCLKNVPEILPQKKKKKNVPEHCNKADVILSTHWL